ncbi:MAG: hypothetical protein RLZZ299_1427 [Pseudomonadota bacterium]|jgi:hypothetical protein
MGVVGFLVLMFAVFGGCACSGESQRPKDGPRESDDGGDSASDTGLPTAPTDSGVSTDTGAPGQGEVPVGAAWCAAGGVVSGGGYAGTFCLAPVDLASGGVAQGGGYSWTPGPVVILHP